MSNLRPDCKHSLSIPRISGHGPTELKHTKRLGMFARVLIAVALVNASTATAGSQPTSNIVFVFAYQ